MMMMMMMTTTTMKVRDEQSSVRAVVVSGKQIAVVCGNIETERFQKYDGWVVCITLDDYTRLNYSTSEFNLQGAVVGLMRRGATSVVTDYGRARADGGS